MFVKVPRLYLRPVPKQGSARLRLQGQDDLTTDQRMADAPALRRAARRPRLARSSRCSLCARYRGRIAAALAALLVRLGRDARPAGRGAAGHGPRVLGGERLHDQRLFRRADPGGGVLALASALRYYFVVTLGERVVADLRAAVFRHLTRLDPAFFDAAQTGEIVSRLTADTTQVKSAFGASVSIALRNLVLFAGAVVMMVVTSPKLSALVLLAIPLIVLPLVACGARRAQPLARRAGPAGRRSAYAAEAVGAVRTMQAFGMERREPRASRAASEEAYAAARASTKARALLTGAVDFPGLGQRRRRAVVRRAGRAGRRR